jgi:hypothetical protein
MVQTNLKIPHTHTHTFTPHTYIHTHTHTHTHTPECGSDLLPVDAVGDIRQL